MTVTSGEDGVTKGLGLPWEEGVTPFEGISSFIGDPSVTIQTLTFGSCDYQSPSTECNAESTYQANIKNLDPVISFAWALTAGAPPAVITTDPSLATCTVSTTSSTDVTFTLQVTINGTYTDSLEATHVHIDSSPPADPTALIATTVDSESIKVSWTDNADNETGQTLWRSQLPATGYIVVASLGPDVETFTDTGLDSNIQYYYRIEAFNDFGLSGFDQANGWTGDFAPTGLVALLTNPDEIRLDWTLNSSTETAVLIERSTDGVAFAPLTSLAPGAITHVDDTVEEVTTYYYRVYVDNVNGPSSFSNVASESTGLFPPIAPTGLIATAATTTSIALAWTDAAINNTSQFIERSLDGSTGWVDISGSIGADVEAYTDLGLSPGVTYFYRVFATNSGGVSDPSNVDSATPTAAVPNAPTNLAFTQPSDLQFDLTWDDNSSIEDNYYVERSDDGGNIWDPLVTLPAESISHTDTVVTNYVAYQYRVYCDNVTGNSDYSNIITCFAGYNSMLHDKQGNPLEDKIGGYLLDKTSV
jgi:titin